jgi:hypothetical protein
LKTAEKAEQTASEAFENTEFQWKLQKPAFKSA